MEKASLISHLPLLVQGIIMKIHAVSNLPPDYINLILNLLLQIVGGCIYRRIKNTFIRQLFGLTLGVSILCSLYGTQTFIFLFLFITLMYPIVLSRHASLTFWILMSSLTVCMIYYTYYHYLSYEMNVTLSLLGIVIRLHMLSWDIVDGDQIKKKENLVTYARFETHKKQHACVNSISFFVYISYVLFFIHIFSASNLTMNEFLHVSNRSVYKKKGWKDTKNDPSPTYYQITITTFKVLAALCLYFIGTTYFYLEFLDTPQFQNEYNFFFKIVYVPFCVLLRKAPFHFFWKCMDLSLMTSGVGFSGVEYEAIGEITKIKTISWDSGRNINSIKVETPQKPSDLVRNWNMTVNRWLTFYVFYRVEPAKIMTKLVGNKSSKLIITRLTSALIHGVYPGYWIYFFSSGLLSISVENLRLCLPTFEDEINIQKQSPYKLKSILLFIFWILIITIPNHGIALIFFQLELNKITKGIYWFYFMLIGVYTILFQILLRTIGIKQTEINKTKKQR